MPKEFFQVTILRTNEDSEDFDAENDASLHILAADIKDALRAKGYLISLTAVLGNCFQLNIEEKGE